MWVRISIRARCSCETVALMVLCQFSDICGPCSVARRGVQHYVIKFVSDLRQVGGFLRVVQFPPPIKLIATVIEYCWKWRHHQTNNKTNEMTLLITYDGIQYTHTHSYTPIGKQHVSCVTDFLFDENLREIIFWTKSLCLW